MALPHRHYLAFLTLGVLAAVPCRSAGECRLAAPRPANAFYVGESLRFTVTVAGDRQRLQYTVVNHRGTEFRRGSLRVGLGTAVELALPGALPLGHYELRLDLASGRVSDTFCVLPPPWDNPGDYGLFGLHPDDWAPESLLAAAQIGVRNIRHNILWPNTEPRRDEYDWEYLTRGYDWARQSGQEMMVVLGYTPMFQAQRAVNCADWVSQAAFTWHPREANEWSDYSREVMSYAAGKTITWPPSAIIPDGWTVPTEERPWVCGWEIWNEVDLVFYFGDWNRYGDLLHLSFAHSRRLTPDTPVVYGGSTGNFCATAMLFGGSLRYCYDYNCFHPDGDVHDELRLYYSGAQQIPYCAGLPRETVHTEAYCTGPKVTVPLEQYQETPEDLWRTYLTLKGWREVAYYRSGCNGGWVGESYRPCRGTALLLPRAGRYSPTPLYPAFAAARYWLSDATTVGPVPLGEGVSAYAYLKHGQTMLAAWADRPARVTFVLERGAYRVDAMGRRLPLGNRTTWACNLTSSPVVIVGAKPSVYLGPAARQQASLFMDTYYGVPLWEQCTVWYVHRLAEDLANCTDTAAAVGLTAALRRAARIMATQPHNGPAVLGQAQDQCEALAATLLARCQGQNPLPVTATSTLWRLMRVSEWLGELADAQGEALGGHCLTAAEFTDLGTRLRQVRLALATRQPEATYPAADQMLRRAARLLERERHRRGRATCVAAAREITLAERLANLETAVVLQVVPLVDFASGQLMLKAHLLEPGQDHRLRVWVYNHLDHAAAGELTVTTPDLWQPQSVTVPFQAAAGEPSVPVEVVVRIPEDPRPWQRVASFTLNGILNLELPTTLRDRPELWVSGRLNSGAVIPPRPWFVHVGQWVNSPPTSEAISAAPPLRLQMARQALGAN